MLQPTEIERALVVMAHPDDVDFGAAGTVANLTDAGVEVVYCLVTDGQAGGFDHTILRHEMTTIRRGEQTRAAAEVGVSELVFLGHMDGTVVVDMALRHDISRVIRQVRPQVVITQNPLRNLDSTYGSHPDHLATGEATMCAVYPDARNPFAFPGTACAELDDWAVDEVWIPFGTSGDEGVDITENLERKIRALMCHESQHRDPAALEERMRSWWQSVAAEHGFPEGTSAESFRVVDTR
ncbi:MAG: PIG-L deacetylase family protein [Ilumatobacter sp.]|uniref:PIG-L deacetylase family protein n=1 Tax=Ilumatobacter sp. TaxID=1967498 RepID=UPI00391B79D0